MQDDITPEELDELTDTETKETDTTNETDEQEEVNNEVTNNEDKTEEQDDKGSNKEPATENKEKGEKKMADLKTQKVAPRYLIADTCDVTFERISDGKLIATAEAQLASISQTVDEQEVRGGIGGAQIATVTSQKAITASFRDALFSQDYLEMTQGTSTEEDMDIEYWVNMGAEVEAEDEDKYLALKNESNKNIKNVVYTDPQTGVQVQLDFDNGKSTSTLADITGAIIEALEGTDLTEEDLDISKKANSGELITVTGLQTQKGSGISIRADKFPEKFRLTYRTVAYNPETGEHAKDIIIQFYEVKPSANFDLGFEMSTPLAPEFELQVTKPMNCNEMGKIVTVDPNISEVDC